MQPETQLSPEQRARRSANSRRLAWLLALVALAVYVGFIVENLK